MLVKVNLEIIYRKIRDDSRKPGVLQGYLGFIKMVPEVLFSVLILKKCVEKILNNDQLFAMSLTH